MRGIILILLIFSSSQAFALNLIFLPPKTILLLSVLSVIFINSKVYEKDGKTLPGKKGISLTVEQYQALGALFKNGSLQKEVNALTK